MAEHEESSSCRAMSPISLIWWRSVEVVKVVVVVEVVEVVEVVVVVVVVVAVGSSR